MIGSVWVPRATGLRVLACALAGCGGATSAATSIEAPAGAGRPAGPATATGPAASASARGPGALGAPVSSDGGASGALAPSEAGALVSDDADPGGTVRIGAIAGTPGFQPGPVLEARRPAWLACYQRARRENPALHGRLRLRIQVGEDGRVVAVDPEPGARANDSALVSCLADDLKQNAQFSRPGGTATVIAPLVFQR